MMNREELMERIGANIKREREAAGLTQEALAEKVNLEVKTLSKVERGKVGISVMTLYQICEVLHISSSVIMSKASTGTNVNGLTEQLKSLSPEQFELVSGTIKNILRAFELGKQ